MNDQEPGSETFLPAKYTLRIYDTADRKDGSLIYFQASSPFPNFTKGDYLKTTSWSLRQEGKLVLIEEIHHSLYSIEDQVYCETHLYCEFQPSTEP